MRRLIGFSGLTATILLILTAYAQEPDRIRVNENSLNLRDNSFGWAEVLGEVLNHTDYIIGHVRVTITLKDVDGKVLATATTFVAGKNVQVDGFSSTAGIFPGESAPFSRSFSETSIDGVETAEYIVTYDVADPRTDLDETPIMIRISSIDSFTIENRIRIEAIESLVDSLRTGSGTSSSKLIGDLDNNGVVDFADFLVFVQNFGRRV